MGIGNSIAQTFCHQIRKNLFRLCFRWCFRVWICGFMCQQLHLPMSLPTKSATLHKACQETKENIGLVVALPRTYPLPVTNTLSHCCQLQSSRPKAFHPVARTARKQRKTLGWWWSYLSPASDKHSLTLLPTPTQSLSSWGQNKLMGVVLVVVLPRTKH